MIGEVGWDLPEWFRGVLDEPMIGWASKAKMMEGGMKRGSPWLVSVFFEKSLFERKRRKSRRFVSSGKGK